MKSLVLIKQVPEAPSIQGEPGGEGTVGSDTRNVTNPYDLFAIEEALQMRDKHGGEVTALTLGPGSAVEALREALAMGVDHAIHVTDPSYGELDAAAASHVLSAAVQEVGGVDIVFTGKQTIDTNSAATAPMVARHLGVTLLTEVFRMQKVDLEGGSITVERLLEGGVQVVRAKLPAVVAVTKDINRPRYASLLGIRKASRAPITVWGSAELGSPPPSATQVSRRTVPAGRPAGELFEGETDELVEKLVEKLAEGRFI